MPETDIECAAEDAPDVEAPEVAADALELEPVELAPDVAEEVQIDEAIYTQHEFDDAVRREVEALLKDSPREDGEAPGRLFTGADLSRIMRTRLAREKKKRHKAMSETAMATAKAVAGRLGHKS